jgi:hypothetical protein
MIFKPASFVLMYFVYLLGYSLWAPGEPNATVWILLDRFHNLIAITAGFSFAFSNRPIDKGAISFLWIYVVLLFCFEWLVPPGYIEGFAVIAAGFIGWIIYRKYTDNIIFSGERTGRSKDDTRL